MNQLTPIFQGRLVELLRFNHPPQEIHRDPSEEVAPHHSISFVERGSFDLVIGRRNWRLTPGRVFVTWPGLVYRCHHVEEIPTDVCVSVTYSGSFVEDIRRTTNGRSARLSPVLPPTNRLGYLRLTLIALAERQGNKLALETLAGELLAAATARNSKGESKLYADRQLAWYTERVEAARCVLQAQYAEVHSLVSLARAVGMSPFHFARVFRELVGTPPHRYLLNVRLTRAAQRLREGAGVTDTCFAVGFSNLSHFIRLFRRAFGVSPSQFSH